MVSASRRWWDRLSAAQRGPLEKLINETIQVQKEYNWCFDKMAYDKYGTKDPSKPGVYWMTPAEVSAMVGAMAEALITPAMTQASTTQRNRQIQQVVQFCLRAVAQHPRD